MISVIFVGLFALSLSAEIPFKRAIAPNVQFSEYPWVVLILGGGVNNTVLHTCTGSVLDEGAPNRGAMILTSSFCVRDRPDPDQAGAFLIYKVLMENPIGDITLLGQNFTQFGVDKVMFHPQAGMLQDYQFSSRYPNGTALEILANLDTHDMALVQLEGPITIPGVQRAKLSGRKPAVGNYVGILSYGAPNFFYLTKTLYTEVLPSYTIQNGKLVINQDQLFIQDKRLGRIANNTEAGEAGDEGAPLIDSDGAIVGVVQGSWRINLDGTSYPVATVGPLMRAHLPFIESHVDSSVNVPQPVSGGDAIPPDEKPIEEPTGNSGPSGTGSGAGSGTGSGAGSGTGSGAGSGGTGGPSMPEQPQAPTSSGFTLVAPLALTIAFSLFTQ